MKSQKHILIFVILTAFLFTMAGCCPDGCPLLQVLPPTPEEPSPESDFVFDKNTGTITKYQGPGSIVIIPSTIGDVPVENIGDWAFYHRRGENVTKVIIPDGVKSIGESAFEHCYRLNSINIPDSVENIGWSAFSATDLNGISIPGSVKKIPLYLFYQCFSLTNVNIQEGVEGIEYNAFFSCSKLTDVDIPDSVTRIANEAFRSCYSLKSIHIGKGVTKIEDMAFVYCKELARITIDDGVTLGKNLIATNNNNFRDAYIAVGGGAGIYEKQVDGTWVKQ